MRVVRVREYGGPEVLKVEEAPNPEPGPGQALVRVEAAGVNFMDVYVRSGTYRANNPVPLTPGSEGAGVVEAVGPEVTEVKPGDRVAWATVPGSYAEYNTVPAARLVPIPRGLSARDAAAVLLQGITAHYLATSTYPLKAGDVCLIQAAAGGLGQLLCQVAKLRGARVIGTAGSPEKAEIAKQAGADDVILYRERDLAQAARELTGGTGVRVVYDSVGKDTFDKSLDSLARRGFLVLVGHSSGRVPPVNPMTLNAKGSLYLTRPSLVDHTSTREELLMRAGEVLGWLAAGKLRVRVDREYPLDQASEAHRALEARETAGKVLLIP